MKRALFVVLFIGLLSGQTADVQVLVDMDALAVLSAWTELQVVQQRWADINEAIKKKYRADGEIEFSRDFKAFVAKPTSGTGLVWGGWGGVTACGPRGTNCTITYDSSKIITQ